MIKGFLETIAVFDCGVSAVNDDLSGSIASYACHHAVDVGSGNAVAFDVVTALIVRRMSIVMS